MIPTLRILFDRANSALRRDLEPAPAPDDDLLNPSGYPPLDEASLRNLEEVYGDDNLQSQKPDPAPERFRRVHPNLGVGIVWR